MSDFRPVSPSKYAELRGSQNGTLHDDNPFLNNYNAYKTTTQLHMVKHKAPSPNIVRKGTADRSSQVPALLHNPFLGTFDPYRSSNAIAADTHLDLGATFPDRAASRSGARSPGNAPPRPNPWQTTTTSSFNHPEDQEDRFEQVRRELQSRGGGSRAITPKTPLRTATISRELRASGGVSP